MHLRQHLEDFPAQTLLALPLGMGTCGLANSASGPHFVSTRGGSGNIDGLLGAIQPVFIRAVCFRLPRVWTLLCATGAAASRRSASLRSTRCSRCSRYDGYSPMATPAAMVRWYDSNVGGLSSADIGEFSGARASRCAAHVSIWIRVCYRL